MSCARVLTNAGLQDLQICQSEGCFIFQCLVLVNCILAPTTVSATLRFFLQKLLLALSNFTLVQEPALWGTHPSESKVHTLAFATRFLSSKEAEDAQNGDAAANGLPSTIKVLVPRGVMLQSWHGSRTEDDNDRSVFLTFPDCLVQLASACWVALLQGARGREADVPAVSGPPDPHYRAVLVVFTCFHDLMMPVMMQARWKSLDMYPYHSLSLQIYPSKKGPRISLAADGGSLMLINPCNSTRAF